MLTCRHFVVMVVSVAGLAVSAYAQDHKDQDKNKPGVQTTEERTRTEVKQERRTSEGDVDRQTTLVPSTRAEGVTVVGAEEARLGVVKDLIVRGSSGRVVYALVTRGMPPAYAQSPERVVAVPFAAFTWDEERKLLTLPTTEDQFKAASSIETDKWNTLTEPTQASNVYTYFDVPAERAELDRKVYRVKKTTQETRTHETRTDDKTVKETKTIKEERTDKELTKKEDRTDKDHIKKEERTDKDHSKTVQNPDKDRVRTEDTSLARSQAEGSLVRVSSLRGKQLLAQDGKDMGLIHDVIFDGSSGQIAFLVITPASSMNAGDGRIGVPWPAFEVDQSGRLYALNLDQEALRSAPRLTQTDWAELRTNNYTEDMYKRFGYEEPRWERSNNVTTKTSSRTETRTEWKDNYAKALKNGTDRTVTGRIESVNETSTDNGVKMVIVNVKTDDGEMVPVHVATRDFLDKQHWKLKQGDTVTVTGKTIDMNGKPCVCACEIASTKGEKIVVHTSDKDLK